MIFLTNIFPIERAIPDKTFINLMFMTGIILLVVIRLVFFKDYHLIYYGKNKASQETNALFGMSLGLVYVIFLSLCCLPFSQLGSPLIFSDDIYQYFLLFGLFSLYFFIKTLFSMFYFIGMNRYKDFDKILHFKILFGGWKIIVAILATLYIYYIPVDKTYGLHIILILFISIQFFEIVFEFFTHFSHYRFSWFYKILYLCTLEILPILIMFKIIFKIDVMEGYELFF